MWPLFPRPRYAQRGIPLVAGDADAAAMDLGDLSRDDEAEVLSGRAWTAPTVVGTKVYLRDRTVIKALELGQ